MKLSRSILRRIQGIAETLASNYGEEDKSCGI